MKFTKKLFLEAQFQTRNFAISTHFQYSFPQRLILARLKH